MPDQNRKLAAILFTDIVGYTAMMQQNEPQAVSMVKHYIQVLKEKVSEHNGQILNDYGDGSLCVFPSATEALKASIKIQKDLQTSPAVPLRIGLHMGEIFFEDEKVMGDSINVASRIQSLGQANTILFSKEIADKLKNQPEFKIISLGSFGFKNVDEPMEVYALTGEGLKVPKREEMSGKLKEINKKSALSKWLAATAILILLAIGFIVFKNKSAITSFKGEKTIAVLPFENTTTDNSEEYISDGITQDIINNLSKISSLQKVIGWFSVRSFKKTTKTLQQIANELGVSAILSGTIQKHNGKTRIITELIEAGSNIRLWGDDFEYEGKDILSIQSKVATEIVTALQATVTPEEKKKLAKNYTGNVEAYAHYIKGRYFWDIRTAVSFDSAELHYKKAIELDPNFALAYTGLADLYIFNQRGLTQLEAIPIARDYIKQALLLDSTLTEALTSIGFIQSAFDYDWANAKITLEKALKYNPNYAYAHIFYGNLLHYTGENIEKGIEEINKARELDPLSISINWVLGRNYYFAGKLDLAEKQLKKILSLAPKYNLAKGTLVATLVAQKKYTEAIELAKQVSNTVTTKNEEYQGTLLSYAYAASGDIIRAKAELTKTINEKSYNAHSLVAKVYIALNDYPRAFSELEKAYNDKEIFMYFINADPIYFPVKDYPEFKALLKKMGLN